MKVKKEYILKTVAGQHIVVPIGAEAKRFHGMITLNDTGKFLFESLNEETSIEQLILMLVEAYDVTPEIAKKDVEKFVGLLDKHQILESKI
jgi:hypothetical protein